MMISVHKTQHKHQKPRCTTFSLFKDRKVAYETMTRQHGADVVDIPTGG